MSRIFTTAAFAACGLLWLATGVNAAEMKIGGTMSASVTQQQVIPLGSADRIAITMLDKGTTKSSGSPLDGATIMLAEEAVLDKGNGPQIGTITLANDKGSITNEIHGAVKTVMVDGQPRVSTSGTYKMVDGTGLFAGASGHGTYSAAFTSKTDWEGEYKGVLVLPKHEASR